MIRNMAPSLVGLIGISLASVAQGALTDGLVHYYTFEEDSYSSGWLPSAGTYTLGGTKAGLAEGKIGQALGTGSSFAGTASMAGEYFQPGVADWTLSLWVKQAPITAARGIVARGGYSSGGTPGGWQIVRNPSGTLSLNYIDSGYHSAPSTVTLPDDTWGYLTIRRKGSLFQVLLNGSLAIEETLSSPTANIAPNVGGDTWNREFRSGLTDFIVMREGDALDELAVWTRALADPEIRWLYNDGEGRSIAVEPTLRDGLQQYLPLDTDFSVTEGSGDLTDVTGTANFLTPGKFGGALAGTTGRIKSTPDDNSRFSPETGDFTVALWFKPATGEIAEAGECIIAKGAATPADHGTNASSYWNGGWNLRLNAARTVTLRFFVGVGNAEGNAKFITSDAPISATGEWVHLAYTRKGTTVTLYINGQPQTQKQTLAAGASISARDTAWGRELDTRGMSEGEMIDELAFWNRALTTAELQTIAAGTASIAELTDPGETTFKRNIAAPSENWSTPAWFNSSGTDLPWSDAVTDAELTFTQLAASITVDRPVELESLFIKPTGTASYVNLQGAETLSFGNMGVINTINVAADNIVSFNLPVTAGVIDLAANGTPSAGAPQWMGRVRFENLTAESLIVRGGFIELPDSPAAPNYQVDLITLLGGSGAAVAQNGIFNSTYSGDLAISETAYIHVRDTATSSPDATLTLNGRVSGKGTLQKRNTGTLALSGTTAIDGSMHMIGGTTAFFTGDHIVTDRTSVQAATLAVGGDARLSLGRIVANDDAGANSTIRQTGGDIVITGTDNSESNAASIILAHWNAHCTYSMTGGSLTSAAAKIRAVHGGRLTWNIENATVTAPGIYSAFDNAHASTITLGSGAVMTLGAAGISLPSATTFTLNDGATLAFTATATNNKTLTLGGNDPGAVLDLGGGTLTQSGFAGEGTVAVTSATPATLMLGSGGTTTPLINLGKNITLDTKLLPLEITSGATAENWKTLSGGTFTCVDNLALIHTPGDSVVNNCIAVYTGRFYVTAEQAGSWYFAGNYDDNIMLTVDGVEVFASADYQAVGSGSIEDLTEGWHTFEVRAREINGADGPNRADWKAAAMSVGYRIGTAPSDVVAASEYTRFGPENILMESPLVVASIISGGSVKTDNLKLTQWRVHLGANEDATRISTFDQPMDLDGVAVSFTVDAVTMPGGYVLGTFLNPDKATYTGLPPGYTVRIEANGRVSVGNFGLRILLF